MSLLVNHTKPTNTFYWNEYILTAGTYKSASGQLQNRKQLQNNTVNEAMSITVNRVISSEIWSGKITCKMIFTRCLMNKKTQFSGATAGKSNCLAIPGHHFNINEEFIYSIYVVWYGEHLIQGYKMVWETSTNITIGKMPISQTWFKGCVRCIFANLFCMSKREHFRNKEKCFLFHFESSSHSWDNQILTF